MSWRKQAILGAATFGALATFVAISRTLTKSDGTALDHAIMGFVGRARRPLSNAVAQGFTFLGGVPAVVGVSLVGVVLTRHRPRRAAQIVVGALGGLGAELVVKRRFRRARPTVLEHLDPVGSTSFPSGHSMAAASLALSLAFVAARSSRLRAHRGALLAGAAGLAGGVGASRVYLGVHWPTDVVAGLALGAAWACASESVFDWVA
jgi:undecaprenyl-diphosphatase